MWFSYLEKFHLFHTFLFFAFSLWGSMFSLPGSGRATGLPGAAWSLVVPASPDPWKTCDIWKTPSWMEHEVYGFLSVQPGA